MYPDDYRTWRGTAAELAKLLPKVFVDLQITEPSPSVRSIRLWRTQRLLSGNRSSFRYRQLMEAVATTQLKARGWSNVAVQFVLPGLDDNVLEQHIVEKFECLRPESVTPGVAQPKEPPRPPGGGGGGSGGGNSGRGGLPSGYAEDTAMLLAQACQKEFWRVLSGKDIIRQQDPAMSPEMKTVMPRLGRLYIEEGAFDRAACVHEVLAHCRSPLGSQDWDLGAFRHPGFKYRDVILIDPDFRVPTQDCVAIVQESGRWGEDQIVEARMHQQLRRIADKMEPRGDAVYTLVRELLGRHSLISVRAFNDWLETHRLGPVRREIQDFYQPVHDAWLIKGLAHRCAHCRSLLLPDPRNPDGRCPIRQCRAKHAAKVGEKIDPADGLLVALPQILAYWTGPAVDELIIFDAAVRLGLTATLYPNRDACDIGIQLDGNVSVGIDAKSYTSPVSLALKLNRSIGGLIAFDRRIIAVGDELVRQRPDYLRTLKAELDPQKEAGSLKVHAVAAVLRMLRRWSHAGTS